MNRLSKQTSLIVVLLFFPRFLRADFWAQVDAKPKFGVEFTDKKLWRLKDESCFWGFRFPVHGMNMDIRVKGENKGKLTVYEGKKKVIEDDGLQFTYCGNGTQYSGLVSDLNLDGTPDIVFMGMMAGNGMAQNSLTVFWLSGPGGYAKKILRNYDGISPRDFLKSEEGDGALIIYSTLCNYATDKNHLFHIMYVLKIRGQDLIYDQRSFAGSPFVAIASYTKPEVPTKRLNSKQLEQMLSKDYKDFNHEPVIPRDVLLDEY